MKKKIDISKHEKLRTKIRTAYTEIPVQGLYYNSRSAIKIVHNARDGEVHETFLDPMTSAVILNGLVPKSGVILKGGHGGGKTTLLEKVSYMLTSIPEEEIKSSMISGNDDQNVNTLLASLKIGKLMVTGEEEVIWRNFVKCPVKIIDELNRFPPPAQNALFEILNKGTVEFIDQTYKIDDFMFFATENPNDSGTYPLSKPFVDRFSYCVPAPQIPSAQDQYLLSERPDDKLVELIVKPVMTLEELKEARRLVSQDIEMSPDALIYSIYLTQAVSSCLRGDSYDKSHNSIPVGERCKGCSLDNATAVCKMTNTGLSGRAFLDFQRWSKAYAWFLNAFPEPEKPEVQMDLVRSIAPYLMYHRIDPNPIVIGKDPYHGAGMQFLEDVVEKSTQAYHTIKDALLEIPKVLRGDLEPEQAKLQSVSKDLVVETHFKPLIEEAGKKEFRKTYDQIQKGNMTDESIKKLNIYLAFESQLGPQAQKYLLSKALEKKKEQ